MKKQDEGFTLIELLIVIVILGILATVVVFAVSGIRDSGDESACDAELRTVITGLEAYYAEEGTYPLAGAEAMTDEYFRTDLKYWTFDETGSPSAATDPAIGAPGADYECDSNP